MINKIVAIQGNHPTTLNPKTDTSIFLAKEAQEKKYKIFYYDPKDLSVINSKLLNSGYFIRFNYKNKKNEALFLNHLQKVIDNRTTNADHMISKFSKNEDLTELYDK